MLRAHRPLLLAAMLAVAGLGGCAKKGDLVTEQDVGIVALRTACPMIAVPDYTGDVTLFSAPGRSDAGAIDVVASLTNLRSQCNDTGAKVYSQASFDVLARRTDTRGARHVKLPYFVSVVRGGGSVISKRVGTVAIDFADGQERAQAKGQAAAYIDRAEATLAPEIRAKLTRKRKAGKEEAAIDPLSEPDVRAGLARASFELLLGFQLDEHQLAYNATR